MPGSPCPGGGEIASVPKLAIVVSVLCTTPRAVLVSSRGSAPVHVAPAVHQVDAAVDPIPSSAGSTRDVREVERQARRSRRAPPAPPPRAGAAQARSSVSDSRRHSANKSSAIASAAPSSASRNALHHHPRGLDGRDGDAGRLRQRLDRGVGEVLQRDVVAAEVVLGIGVDPHAAVGGDRVAHQLRRQVARLDRLACEGRLDPPDLVGRECRPRWSRAGAARPRARRRSPEPPGARRLRRSPRAAGRARRGSGVERRRHLGGRRDEPAQRLDLLAGGRRVRHPLGRRRRRHEQRHVLRGSRASAPARSERSRRACACGPRRRAPRAGRRRRRRPRLSFASRLTLHGDSPSVASRSLNAVTESAVCTRAAAAGCSRSARA